MNSGLKQFAARKNREKVANEFLWMYVYTSLMFPIKAKCHLNSSSALAPYSESRELNLGCIVFAHLDISDRTEFIINFGTNISYFVGEYEKIGKERTLKY